MNGCEPNKIVSTASTLTLKFFEKVLSLRQPDGTIELPSRKLNKWIPDDGGDIYDKCTFDWRLAKEGMQPKSRRQDGEASRGSQ